MVSMLLSFKCFRKQRMELQTKVTMLLFFILVDTFTVEFYVVFSVALSYFLASFHLNLKDSLAFLVSLVHGNKFPQLLSVCISPLFFKGHYYKIQKSWWAFFSFSTLNVASHWLIPQGFCWETARWSYRRPLVHTSHFSSCFQDSLALAFYNLFSVSWSGCPWISPALNLSSFLDL